jgi:MFS family permease
MSAAVARRPRTLAVLCVVSTAWAFNFGLGAPLASLWLADHGYEHHVLGLNTAAYYAGIAVMAAVLPRLMAKSARGCIVTGLIVAALATAPFPLAGGTAGWFALRAAGGAGAALYLIPVESLVNRNAPDARRARDFGLYATAVALGIGVGTAVGLPVYAHAPRLAFALGGWVPLLAVAPVLFGLPGGGITEEISTGKVSFSRRDSVFGFGTAWAQGFLEGGMVTFLSVYLVGLGLGEGTAGMLMGVLFVGVVAFQVPVAWLADRAGRVRVLLTCHLLVLGALALLPFLRSTVPLGSLLFVVGGSSAALYPLGLALLGERLPRTALGRANAWYLAWNCGGSLTGPVLMGLAVRAGGYHALFATAAASVALVLAGSALCRRSARQSEPVIYRLPEPVARRAA